MALWLTSVDNNAVALTSAVSAGVGASAMFNDPKGIAVDPNNSGVVYVTDTVNRKVKMLEDAGGVWTVTTIAGSSAACCADGAHSPAFGAPPAASMVSPFSQARGRLHRSACRSTWSWAAMARCTCSTPTITPRISAS